MEVKEVHEVKVVKGRMSRLRVFGEVKEVNEVKVVKGQYSCCLSHDHCPLTSFISFYLLLTPLNLQTRHSSFNYFNFMNFFNFHKKLL